MIRLKCDVESGVPAVSSGDSREPGGKDGSRRLSKSASKTQSSAKLKKRTSKMATTGGGSDAKKVPPFTKPNNTKKLVLASGILLCAVSIAAIVMVLSGNYGPTYNTSMQQFSGELQMQELEGELITWSDDFANLQSSTSESITRLLSDKLTASFEEEGIFVDEVTVTELSPTEPMSFITSRPVDKSATERTKRSADAWMENLTPDQLSEVEVETVEHKDVRFVSTKFVTMGKPSKNAAVFSASNGRWPEVSHMLQSRMSSHGMKVSMSSLTPQQPFMNNVHQAVQTNPALAQHFPAPSPPVSPCDCRLNGFQVRSRVKFCQCDSSCVFPGVGIWGGVNDEFSSHSPICTAAFYAGITQHQGGPVEIMLLGMGEARGGEPRNGISPMTLQFRSNVYKLKRNGPVIQPRVPPPIFGNSGMNVGAPTADQLLFTLHVHYQAIAGQPAVFNPAMADPQSSQSREVSNIVIPSIKSAVESLGFRVGSVEVIQILLPPEKMGIIIGFDARGKDDPNVKNAVRLESTDPAKVPFKISQPLMAEGATIRSFRYAREFLGKMTEMMKSGGEH